MARACYVETVCSVAGDGTLKALTGVSVTVKLRGESTLATIFSDPTNDDVITYPYLTTGGLVEFWADVDIYDISYEDTANPKRIPDKTISWDAVSADRKGTSLKQMNDDLLRQLPPVGNVLDWWRPPPVGGDSVPLPSGYEPADGRTIAAGLHDFPISGSITLPDLRNQFILGADADPAKDGTNGANGNLAANAPGVRGGGGSNAVKDLTHTHNSPGHNHGLGSLSVVAANIDHTHGDTAGSNQSLQHQHSLNYQIISVNPSPATQAIASLSFNPHDHGKGVAMSEADSAPDHLHGSGTPDHTHGTYGMNANVTHGHSLTGSVGGGGPSGDSAIQTTAASANITSTHDVRPRYYGLIKLIKVRRI